MNDMRLVKKRLWPVAAGIVIVVILTVVFFGRTISAVGVVCGPDWASSSDPNVRDVCGQEKLKKELDKEQQDALVKAATPYAQTIPGFQPSVMLPQPADTKLIQEVPLTSPIRDQQQGRPAALLDATSLWQVGSVPNADYTMWDPLMIVTYGGNGAQWYVPGLVDPVTRQENPTLRTFGMAWDKDQSAKYAFTWTCPKPVGEIYITRVEMGATPGIGADGANFQGLNYRVYFNTKIGTAGYFDMATQQWTFNQ